MDVRRCLDLFWGSYAAKSAGRDFDEPLFEDQYSLLEEDLYSDTAKIRVVAPLIGCQLDGAICLQEGLAIAPMRPDDEIHYVETSSETQNRDIGITGFPKMYAIVYDVCLPKRIYHADQQNDNGMEWANVMDNVITALCLFREGSFVVEGFLVTSASFFCAHTQRMRQRQRYGRGGSLHVKEADTQRFTGLFRALSSKTIKSHGAINMALHRFRYASERDREEDRLVDLLIAAESLFLQDGEGELSYRLRQRVALLLGTGFDDRLKIAEDIKTAYSLRSKIVHGDGGSKRPKPLGEIAPKIEGYLRASLQRAISLAESNNVGPKKAWMEWDRMIYEKCGAFVTPAKEGPGPTDWGL